VGEVASSNLVVPTIIFNQLGCESGLGGNKSGNTKEHQADAESFSVPASSPNKLAITACASRFS
jgi:hypothetical protein